MNTKHTPGPWTIDGKNIKHYTDNGFTKVARVGDYMAARNDEANARLIAAAPELLEAAIAYVQADKDGNNTRSRIAMKQLRAAIAKATGETI